MKDSDKEEGQLVSELEVLRGRMTEFEEIEARLRVAQNRVRQLEQELNLSVRLATVCRLTTSVIHDEMNNAIA